MEKKWQYYNKKYEQFKSLRETAWLVKRAAFRRKYPELGPEEIEEKVKKAFLYAST